VTEISYRPDANPALFRYNAWEVRGWRAHSAGALFVLALLGISALLIAALALPMALLFWLVT